MFVLSIIVSEVLIMQQMYNIDIKEAFKGYDVHDGRYYASVFAENQINLAKIASRVPFSAYSPAYVMSNELVEEMVDFVKPDGKSALAVAGSGDIPICLTANGAKHVDTFDISYNARVIMDIKTYMLHKKTDYFQYLHNLRALKDSSNNLMSGECSNIIRRAVTPQTLDYVIGMSGKYLLRGDDFRVYFPGYKDFENIQNRIHGRYNFIWTDLFDLCGHIQNKTYDIIYLSNVFQYVESEQIVANILTNLSKNHLNKDGIVVVDSLLSSSKCAPLRHMFYHKVRKNMPAWAEFKYNENAESLFLRVR